MPSESKQDRKEKSLDQNAKSQPTPKKEMYTSITIKGFRLFDELKMDALSSVNLIIGPNNSGKTSMLEAVYTHACGPDFGSFLYRIVPGMHHPGALTEPIEFGERLITTFRDRSTLPYGFSISGKMQQDSSIYTAKVNFQPSSKLAILDPRTFGQSADHDLSDYKTQLSADSHHSSPAFIGRWEINFDQQVSSFDLNFPPLPVLSALPFKLAFFGNFSSHRQPGAEAKVFSYFKRYGLLEQFTEEIRLAFPEIKEIDMIPYRGGQPGPVIITTNDGQRLPLYTFGSGLRRWFYQLGHMLIYQNAVHCIDHVDASMHATTHEVISALLIQYAEKFNNQIFLTTRNIEFANTFLKVIYEKDGLRKSKGSDPVRIYSIKRTEKTERPEVWILSGRDAYEDELIREMEMR